jgi:hypothetical protein
MRKGFDRIAGVTRISSVLPAGQVGFMGYVRSTWSGDPDPSGRGWAQQHRTPSLTIRS